jgi:hypothetical protein
MFFFPLFIILPYFFLAAHGFGQLIISNTKETLDRKNYGLCDAPPILFPELNRGSGLC